MGAGVAPRQLFRGDGQAQPGKVPQPRADRSLELEPGKMRPQAEMGADAEGEVMIVPSAEIEAVGLVEGGRIPVGGCVGDQDRIAEPGRRPAASQVGRRSRHPV